MYFYSIAALLGRPIEDLDGRTVGTVDDLLVDRNDGNIAYVRFSISANEEPAHSLTVPWSAVRMAHETRDVLQIVVSKTALERLAGKGPSGS